jgi:hypothetical protein
MCAITAGETFVPSFRVPDPLQRDAVNRRQRGPLSWQSGGVTLGTFLFLFLIAGAIYLTLLYLPPWMAYRAMLDQIQEQAGTAAITSDNEIMTRLMATAREWEIPVTEDQIELKRTDTRVSISTQWDVTINLFGGQYQHILHFAPSTEAMVLPARR